MNTGFLNRLLVFYPETQTKGSDGFYTNAEGAGVTIRAKVVQITGARKMQYQELVNAEVYEATCFNNAAITKNAKVTYAGKTLYIHSIIDVDEKSFTEVRKLILYTK